MCFKTYVLVFGACSDSLPFTTIAVLTLTLGIGATAGVFSLIQGVLLTSPPYRQPQQLMLITPVRTDGQKLANARGWAAEQWMEWQRTAKSFESIAAYNWSFSFLVLRDGSESLEGMWVTGDYFGSVGIAALPWTHLPPFRNGVPAKAGHHLGLRVLAAAVQWRS